MEIEHVFEGTLSVIPDFKDGMGVGGSMGLSELEKYKSDNYCYE